MWRAVFLASFGVWVLSVKAGGPVSDGVGRPSGCRGLRCVLCICCLFLVNVEGEADRTG